MNSELRTATIARDIAEEHNCPFYGCHAIYGMLIESGGNQCALIEDSYSPCKMEMAGLPVEWKTCPVFLARRVATVA